MKNYEGRNLTMLTDFYELTMAQSYFDMNRHEKVIFDLFYRKNPFDNGFAIACGIDDAVEYVRDLHFTDEDVDYLRSLGIFSDGFLNYLSNFKFTGNMFAVENGTVVFPMEPIGVLRCAEQGFVTEQGYFVDRITALHIADYYDQINKKYNPQDRLVSEDLKKEHIKILSYKDNYSYKEKSN